MLKNEFVKLNEAIKSAGKIILQYYGKQLQLHHKKTSVDYRTKADVEAEKVIIKAIEAYFPEYNIFSEEHGHIQKRSQYTFIVDPLDGTNNFVLGIPIFTTSVALMRKKEIIYGVINHPISGDIYYALKGKGAFLNGAPISVNFKNNKTHSTISYSCGYMTSKERILNFESKLSKLPVGRILNLWAPTACYCRLACGKIEAIINDKTELYDFAAGRLIATEAGAKITDFLGDSFAKDDTANKFLISNGTTLHSIIVNNVTKLLK